MTTTPFNKSLPHSPRCQPLLFCELEHCQRSDNQHRGTLPSKNIKAFSSPQFRHRNPHPSLPDARITSNNGLRDTKHKHHKPRLVTRTSGRRVVTRLEGFLVRALGFHAKSLAGTSKVGFLGYEWCAFRQGFGGDACVLWDARSSAPRKGSDGTWGKFVSKGRVEHLLVRWGF